MEKAQENIDKHKRYHKQDNGLYTKNDLSKNDLKNDLYLNYIPIRTHPKRRKYINKAYKEYKENNQVFPEWAKNEKQFLARIKKVSNDKYFATENGKDARKRINKKFSSIRSDMRKNRDKLNKKERGKLERMSGYQKTYYRKCTALINAINTCERDLSDRELEMALARIRGVLHIGRLKNSKVTRCHNLKLDDKLKQIARDNDINQFKEYLKKRKNQGVEIDNLFDDFENINNQPFNLFMPLDENEEDQKEANFKFYIPEDNSPENGEQQKIEDGIDKTINYWGLTTFKPMENQQENGYFSLNNTDNILCNDDSQGF